MSEVMNVGVMNVGQSTNANTNTTSAFLTAQGSEALGQTI